MKNTFRYLFALPLFFALSACVVVPTGGGGEEPYAAERMATIEIGKSRKEDVAAVMPQPIQFLDGTLWLYPRQRRESRWTTVTFIGVPDSWLPNQKNKRDKVFGPSEPSTSGNVDYRYLVIRFDDNDVVAGYITSSMESPVGCSQSGVCRLEGTYMLAAPQDENRAVKSFDTPADRCGVYVYGMQSRIVPFTLDNRRIGKTYDDKRFLFEQVEPGTHELKAAYTSHGPIKFDCAAGDAVFFEVNTRRLGFFGDEFEAEVTQRSAAEGQQAVATRDWMLLSDSDSGMICLSQRADGSFYGCSKDQKQADTES